MAERIRPPPPCHRSGGLLRGFRRGGEPHAGLAAGQCDEVVSTDDLSHVLNAADGLGAGPFGDRGASVLGCGQGAAPGNSTQCYVPVMVKIPGSELALARSGGTERALIDFLGEGKDECGATVSNVRA